MLAGCGSATVAPAPATPQPVPGGHHLKTVFLIVMENHNWSAIKGSGSAPYINHILLPMASYASQYYNPPRNHPSLPNYLWLEAGTNCFASTGCVRSDGNPSQFPITTHRHLIDLLQHAGISWQAYAENIPPDTCPTQSAHLYAPKHLPFVYFTDVTSRPAYCKAHIRPFTQFAGDLQHHRVARYNFIAPNTCDDMHSFCSFPPDRVRQGDSWLARVMPAILRSRAYRDGGVVFITWDEGTGGDGPIGLIVLSPDAKGHGYTNQIRYTHSSTLRTIEEIFQVQPILGHAADAADLRDLFRVFP